jgi:hypothetical protein
MASSSTATLLMAANVSVSDDSLTEAVRRHIEAAN